MIFRNVSKTNATTQLLVSLTILLLTGQLKDGKLLLVVARGLADKDSNGIWLKYLQEEDLLADDCCVAAMGLDDDDSN